MHPVQPARSSASWTNGAPVHRLDRRRRPGFFRVTRPDELWHLDMTSVWVAEHGWCYLMAAIDCCTSCGRSMHVIETFARGQTPHHQPAPRPTVIWIDTS